MRNWGVMISGNGSNLSTLLEHNELNISVVISSSAKAYGVKRAKRKGVPVEIIPENLKLNDMEEWVLKKLKVYNVKNLFLAGFMKILSPNFINKFKGEVINIHPSLLPKHKGLHAFEKAVEAGDGEFGVSIHHVVAEVDSGKIILQKKFKKPNKLLLHITEQQALKQIKWGQFK
ncbi:MAG: phosphoribosylglycinamide formyltransferase [Oligoflexia bacterium]|nr:phosphoribosylglycinamide formyltransferase [Oligoflexia bacterium]